MSKGGRLYAETGASRILRGHGARGGEGADCDSEGDARDVRHRAGGYAADCCGHKPWYCHPGQGGV